jgi:enediyne biosynthesis protein E7
MINQPDKRMEENIDSEQWPIPFLDNLVKQYGDTYQYKNAFGQVYFFNHPDQVQEILLSSNFVRTPFITMVFGEGLLASDGVYWRQQRRVMQPQFHDKCLPGFAPVIVDAAVRMLDEWQQKQEPVSLSLEMRKLTLDVVMRAMFSFDLGADMDPMCAAVTTVIEDLGILSHTLFNCPANLTPSRNAEFRSALKTMDQIVERLIEERRSRTTQPRDLLTMLFDAKNDEGISLTPRQLRDEIVTIIIAGHETTASSLAWSWIMLQQHPEVEQRLHREIDAVLGGRLPEAADLPVLKVAELIFQETIRLYPPVWFMMRSALEETMVGDINIPKGGTVLVSPYTTHRHPKFWSRPDEFDPDRFAPERAVGRHRFAHFPFAGGRHFCLGQTFAMMEAQLILATVAQRWRVIPAGQASIQKASAITLRLDERIPAYLQPRPG